MIQLNNITTKLMENKFTSKDNIIDSWLHENGYEETTKQVEREAEEITNTTKTLDWGTINITPPPMIIRISNPQTNEVLGEFKEKDGLLTFEGNVDEAGKVFVDYICRVFKQRIEYNITNNKIKI
jgi:hypothetical protein